MEHPDGVSKSSQSELAARDSARSVEPIDESQREVEIGVQADPAQVAGVENLRSQHEAKELGEDSRWFRQEAETKEGDEESKEKSTEQGADDS